MPLFFNRTKTDSDGAGDDRDAWGVAKSKTTIRTVAPLNGFKKLSEADLAKEKKELEEMKAFIKRFKELVKLRLQRETLDVEATKELQLYQSELAKLLIEKQAAVTAKEVAIEKLRLPQAKMAQTLQGVREQVDSQIQHLNQQQKELANKRGWGADK
jgi:hypothetical protein